MEITKRLYPIPAPADDPRFTYGLIADAIKVLERHGYPRPTSGRDLTALQEALFGFLYDLTPTDSVTAAEPITDVGSYQSCRCRATQREHTCIPFS